MTQGPDLSFFNIEVHEFLGKLQGWSVCRVSQKLTLIVGLGCKDRGVESFSVSGDFNGEELDPGGWKTKVHCYNRCHFRMDITDSFWSLIAETYRISCSPPCSLAHSSDGEGFRS